MSAAATPRIRSGRFLLQMSLLSKTLHYAHILYVIELEGLLCNYICIQVLRLHDSREELAVESVTLPSTFNCGTPSVHNWLLWYMKKGVPPPLNLRYHSKCRFKDFIVVREDHICLAKFATTEPTFLAVVVFAADWHHTYPQNNQKNLQLVRLMPDYESSRMRPSPAPIYKKEIGLYSCYRNATTALLIDYLQHFMCISWWYINRGLWIWSTTKNSCKD